MLYLKENALDVDTYLFLRQQVDWPKLTRYQAECAVSNCLFNVCAYQDDRPVGMGRVVGDGAVISYIQDLVVVPDAQGQHIGSMVLTRLKQYVESITKPGSRMMLCLMCAKGRENFYLEHGFIARPTDSLGPGMIIYIDG
ncbi:MAG: GNAT family N-acetyltransferase [Butyrivibrio sp.]